MLILFHMYYSYFLQLVISITTQILYLFLEIEHTTLCVVLGQPMINTDELSLFEAMVCFLKNN